MTLRKMFFLYSLTFLSVILLLCAILYIVFTEGARKRIYYFADAEEKQVEILQKQIETEQRFSSAWVPPFVIYTEFNKNDEIVSSNGSAADQKSAQEFLNGIDIPHSQGYFVKVLYSAGACVFKYHIGMRYASDWANRNLPGIEILFITVLSLAILGAVVIFVCSIDRLLQKNLLPLKRVVTSIGEGDLNYPVPHLSLREFEELGMITERMRSDLKSTLQELWVNEHRMREETTQMLHDYRSPLTVARANAEFLKEDLSRISELKNKKKLLAFTEAVSMNLERLTEVGDRLQQQIQANEETSTRHRPLTFNELNRSIDISGKILSEHYGSEWKSDFQDSQEGLPVDERGLKQAINNILINAFEQGREPQTVQVQFVLREGKAEYLITNSGSQFSAKALSEATKKGFSEKRNANQVMKGLGLYFVKQFLREYDGSVTLSNTSQNHACVRISFDLKVGG